MSMISNYTIDPERPIDPPEPPIPRCSKCGRIATEWWPRSKYYYCEFCALNEAQDWIANISTDELLEVAGMEMITWD